MRSATRYDLILPAVLLCGCGAEVPAGPDDASASRPADGARPADGVSTEGGLADGGTGQDATLDGSDAGVPPSELPSTLHGYIGAPEDRALVGALLEGRLSVGEATRIIHVAPPSGERDGVGTRDDPRRDLKAALEDAEPGDHFHLAPGVYPMSEIRDTFGHEGSLVFLRADGTRDRKIVVRTDPDRYDPGAGAVAQLDFGYENGWPRHRTFAMSLSGSHWILEALEIRHLNRTGIWVSGDHNLIRDCHIHHASHDGSNNHGLVVIATAGPTYNLVMGNHLHHSGVLDTATGELLELGGSNGDCTYSETRQGYDSDFSDIDETSSAAELDAAKDPPDSEVYFFNNLVHHCHNGIATKNNSDGPFYVLSNVIHDTARGIKITLSHSLVRNNLIYRGDRLGTGILVGWSTSSGWLSQAYHGVGITVERNTVVGAEEGTAHYSGWNLRVIDNLFLDVGGAHVVRRNPYAWSPSRWPGVVGEWAYADLTEEHPYYPYMPGPLRDRVGEFRRVEASGNVYPAEPVLVVPTEGDLYSLAGTTFSGDHVVLDPSTIRAHLRNPEGGDYRRDPDDPGPLEGIGSGITGSPTPTR